MSIFTDDGWHVFFIVYKFMIEKLVTLGLTPKEAHVYLVLLEFGTQPASVIAKKTT